MYNEIPYIEIPATQFYRFDQGGEIAFLLSIRECDKVSQFKVEDAFPWSCAQYDGIAEIVEIYESRPDSGYYYIKIKKVS